MHFKDSDHFQEAIFGHYSGGNGYIKYRSFSRSMREVMQSISSPYPATRLGELLYFGVYEKLKRRGVDPSGLELKSSFKSRADIHHHTDGYFSLLSVPNEPITIDLFNLDSEVCRQLRVIWADEYYGDLPESDCQTIMFQYKLGMADFWKLGGSNEVRWGRIFKPLYFHSNERRPENHLIFTPDHVEDRLRRKHFCELVADYLVKVFHQNMTLLSH
jgi:hypothetical protein